MTERDRAADADDRYQSVPQLSASGHEPTALGATGDLPWSPPMPRWMPLGELGAGGMGQVRLMADRWLERSVALKEPTTDADAQRFWREARVTARLEHPGIVAIYDLGLGPTGRPWFAMRVVRGRSVGELVRAERTVAARLAHLRHLLAACEAIGYAHSQGIVHRDVKPDNIMIGAFGETQVIDWGLALAPEVTDTNVGVAGTPAYMSPEQARGQPADARCDVWALGAVLFELAAGRPAFAQATRDEVLAAIGAGRMPSLDEVAGVPRELAAIVRRAMAPDPEQRYPDAKALADDLASYLDGRRVAAHEYSAMELARRFLVAWRVPLVVALVGMIALSIAVAVGVANIDGERRQSRANLALSLLIESQRALRDDRLGSAEVLASEALASAESGLQAAEARGVISALGGVQPVRTSLGEAPCRVVDMEGDRWLCADDDSVWVITSGRTTFSVSRANRGAAFVGGGQRVAILAQGGYEVWHADTGELLEAHPEGPSWVWLVPGADARGNALIGSSLRIARLGVERVDLPISACGEEGVRTGAGDPSGRWWSVACSGGELIVGGEGGDQTRYAAGLGTGASGPHTTALGLVSRESVLVGAADGSVQRLNLSSGAVVSERLAMQRGIVRRIVVSPSGRWAVVLADESPPLVLDLVSGLPLLRLPQVGVTALSFPDARTLIVAARTLERWDLEDLRPRAALFPNGVTGLALSPDGASLAVANNTAVAWLDLATRAVVARAKWQDSVIKGIGFDGADTLVAHGMGTDRLARVGRDGSLGEDYRVVKGLRLRDSAVLADGSVLGTAFGPRQVLMSRAQPPEDVLTLALTDLAASPDGRLLVLLEETGEIRCARDYASTRTLSWCGHDRAARVIGASDDGRVLTGAPSVLTSWSPRAPGAAADQSEQLPDIRYLAPGAELTAVAATGDRLAAGARDGAVWIWQVGSPNAIAVVRDHTERVSALVFGPNADWLASGSWDGKVDFLVTRVVQEEPADVVARWGLGIAEAMGSPSGLRLEAFGRTAPGAP